MGRVCKVYEYVKVDVEDVCSYLSRLRGIHDAEEQNAKIIEWFGFDPEEKPEVYDMIFDYSEMVETFLYKKELNNMALDGHKYLQDLFDLFYKEVYL
jgi:hypothetical protein